VIVCEPVTWPDVYRAEVSNATLAFPLLCTGAVAMVVAPSRKVTFPNAPNFGVAELEASLIVTLNVTVPPRAVAVGLTPSALIVGGLVVMVSAAVDVVLEAP
jgi:hypothetical protein